MALISMTGFGRGSASAGGLVIDVELGSVNRKQFDARVSLPRALSALEPKVLLTLRERLARGQISAVVRMSAADAATGCARIDIEAAKACLKELRTAADTLGLPFDLTASSLLQMKDAIMIEKERDYDPDTIWPTIEKATQHALRELMKMRQQEGKALQADLEKRANRLRVLRDRIQKRAPAVPTLHLKELRKRLQSAGTDFRVDDPALQRELILFADRSDVSEELVRLGSHLAQFAGLLTSGKAVGRALDFVCQEMFREINTLGTKANDGVISTCVIQFKTDLEAMREQVQNVE